MINFAELVDRVDQRNRANREQIWQAVSPYLEMAVRKSTYNRELKNLSEGYGSIAQQEGFNYTPPTTSGGRLQSPELLGASFNSQRGIAQQSSQGKAWYEANNLPVPENWDTMNPQQRAVAVDTAQRGQQESAPIQAALDAYPEVRSLLPANFDSLPSASKRAVLDRKINEWVNSQAALAAGRAGGRSGGGGSGGGSGVEAEGKAPTASQVEGMQQEIDNARALRQRYSSGTTVNGVSVQTRRVRFNRTEGRNAPLRDMVKTMGQNPIYFDGSRFYNAEGGTVTLAADDPKATALVNLWGADRQALATVNMARTRQNTMNLTNMPGVTVLE